jgi:ribosomal-protein-alanine N-acetyltransferase
MILNTSRLIGRPVTRSDLNELIAMFTDEAFSSRFGVSLEPEKITERVEKYCQQWEKYGYGYWIWRLQVSNQFIGLGGLKDVTIEHHHEVVLAYSVQREYWQQGFAAEFSKTAVDFAFKTLHLPNLVYYTLPENTVSQHLMQQLGFNYERNIFHAGLNHRLSRLINQPES